MRESRKIQTGETNISDEYFQGRLCGTKNINTVSPQKNLKSLKRKKSGDVGYD